MPSYQGGVVANGQYLPTESGLQSSGFLDRLTAAVDNRAAYQGMLRGYGPALRDTGIPIAQPQGFLDQMLSRFGIGGQPQPQAQGPLPTATNAQADSGGAPPPTMGGAGPQGPMTAGAATGPLAGNALASLVGTTAQKYNIDPMTALRVVKSEGGFAPATAGDAGSSFGPFQLHYAAAGGGPNSAPGLGDDFTRQTGLDARDPANAPAAIDFALRDASRNGWGKFHGAARAGIGQWDGIGGAPSQMSAYAPASGSSSASPRPPTPAAQSGADPMPIATAGPTARQVPQPQPSSAVGGPSNSSGQDATTPVAQVLQPLLANASTRQGGAQAWQMYRQAASNGGAQGGLTLPGGMSASSLAAMIAEPTTMQEGLSLFQRALYPPITDHKPGDFIMRGNQVVGQVPQPYQHVVIGKNAYGEDIYGSFDPNSSRITPDAMPSQGGGQPAQPGMGAGAAPALATGPDASLPSGPAFLSALPAPLRPQVQAIAEGRMKLPSGTSANSPLAQRLKSYVLQYDPTFDQADTDARFETRKDFASGKTAQAINSGNTAVQHAADLSDAAEALGNGRYPLVNKIGQAIGDQTGGNVAGKEFSGALNDFADEVVRFYRNSGGTESDIDAVKSALDPSQSPDQLRAGIQQQARLIAGKTSSLNNQWHQGMGPLAQDYPVLSKDTQAALDRINARRPSVSSYPPRDAAGAGAPAPLPTASPAGSIPTITDPAQAQALPPGTRFRGPDGQLRVRH